MAQTFVNAVAHNVTSSTTVYTAPGATTTVVIGLVVSNVAGSDTTLTATVTKGATTVALISAAPLPSASNYSVLSNNNRIVLQTGDSIAVSAGANVDVLVSAMQIT